MRHWWTEREDDVIRQLYPSLPAKQLPLKRTIPAIQLRAKKLGVKKSADFWRGNIKPALEARDDVWTDNEIELLREIYPNNDIKKLAEVMGRSKPAVYAKASQLRLRKENSPLEKEKYVANILRKFGWEILENCNPNAPCDLIAKWKEQTFCINVKSGGTLVLDKDNLYRMLKTPYEPALIFLTSDKKLFFLGIRELWEEIIAQRKTLYTSKHRLIYTLKDKIMIEILRRGNNVRQAELKKDLVAEGLCSERTIERKIVQLINEGKIGKKGMRDASLTVLTT